MILSDVAILERLEIVVKRDIGRTEEKTWLETSKKDMVILNINGSIAHDWAQWYRCIHAVDFTQWNNVCISFYSNIVRCNIDYSSVDFSSRLISLLFKWLNFPGNYKNLCFKKRSWSFMGLDGLSALLVYYFVA